jgi:hypothetical protein
MAVIYRNHPGEIIAHHGEQGAKDGRRFTREIVGEGVMIEECSFCGSPHATAFWRTLAGAVSVCLSCAVEALPKLMADAVFGENANAQGKIELGQLALRQATVAFWTAANGLRVRSRQRKKP